MIPLIHLIVRQERHLNNHLPDRPETPALPRAPRPAPSMLKENQSCLPAVDLHKQPCECG